MRCCAGLSAHRHPVTLLGPVLEDIGALTALEAEALQQGISPSSSHLWERMSWSKKDHAANALRIAKDRKASAVAAAIATFQGQIDHDKSCAWTSAERSSLKQDLDNLYQTTFSRYITYRFTCVNPSHAFIICDGHISSMADLQMSAEMLLLKTAVDVQDMLAGCEWNVSSVVAVAC